MVRSASPAYSLRCRWMTGSGSAMLLLASTAFAAEPTNDGGRMMLSWDNDIFAQSDNDYTNGASVGWFSPTAKDWHPGFAWAGDTLEAIPLLSSPGARKAVSIDISQAMYTPTDLTLNPPDPQDRPYAGVLLATLGLHQLDGNHLTSVDLSLGTVGEWSGAEATQDLVHTMTGSEEPQGWDSQIGNGTLVNLALERRWRLLELGTPYHGFGVDGVVGAVGMLGNFRTSVIADAGLRIGYRMTSSYGTLSIRPGSEGRLIPSERSSYWGCHMGVMLAGEAVGYDLTLDGRMFQDDDITVDKEPLLGRVALVFGAHVARLQVYLLMANSTPSFEQEDEESSEYGRIILVWTL